MSNVTFSFQFSLKRGFLVLPQFSKSPYKTHSLEKPLLSEVQKHNLQNNKLQ